MRTFPILGNPIPFRRVAAYVVGIVLPIAAAGALAGCADVYLPERFARLSVQQELVFPSTSPGSVATRVILLSNPGNDELVVDRVRLNGPDGVFSHEGLDGLRLQGGESVSATISFTPQDSSYPSGEILIWCNGAQNREYTSIRLSVYEPTLALSLYPNTLDFGRVPANTTSTEVVSVFNRSSVAVEIVALLPLDPAGEFTVSDDDLSSLPRTLAPGEPWDVSLNYTPTNDNLDEVSLNIDYRPVGDLTGTERTSTLPIIGNASAPCIDVTHEDGFDFGPRLVGQLSEERFTIANCSTGEDAQQLQVSRINLLNTDEQQSADSFQLFNVPLLPLRLAPRESITFSATYEPNAVAAQESAWLEVASNDTTKSPLVIEINGEGTDNTCPTAVATCVVRDSGQTPSTRVSADPFSFIDCSAGGSIDPDGDIASYSWTLLKPESSEATLTASNGSETSILLDTSGVYRIALNVLDNQGVEACGSAEVIITTCMCEDLAVELIWTTPRDNNPHDTGPGTGSDVDLHLLQVEEGCWNDTPWDCFGENPQPDWGEPDEIADNPALDANDTDGWGPENIVLNRPDSGRYRVGVEYTDDNRLGLSIATLRIYAFGDLIFERSRELPDTGFFWEVADIEWPSGEVEELNRAYDNIDSAPCF